MHGLYVRPAERDREKEREVERAAIEIDEPEA
jgi:hypothetical protein